MTSTITRIGGIFLTKYSHRTIICRSLSHYPIDDNLFGLNEEQLQVRFYFTLHDWMTHT